MIENINILEEIEKLREQKKEIIINKEEIRKIKKELKEINKILEIYEKQINLLSKTQYLTFDILEEITKINKGGKNYGTK